MVLIKKYWVFICLSLIILVASIFRFYQLGMNPPSLDWDEASLGYNAYSILKTGADEYGNFLPVSIRSFNDYKPAAYVYLTVPSVFLFGLNEFATRFPSAFLGVLTVIVTFFLVKELFKDIEIWKFKSSSIALLSSLFLSISPWHLQFSRAAFEANVGVFFFVTGVYFFVRALEQKKFFILSFLFFAITIYSYHSFRLITPIFVLSLFLYFRKKIWEARKTVILGIIITAACSLPFLLSLTTDLSRFSSVTILNAQSILNESVKELSKDKQNGNYLGLVFHNRRIVFTQNIIKNYLDHFDFNFLFIKGDYVPRQHAWQFGMLYLAELPFVLLGIFYLFFKKNKARYVIFAWFLIAPLAAAVSSGTPHAIRSIPFLPTWQVFSAIGVLYFFSIVSRFNYVKYLSLIIVSGAFLLNFIFYLNLYYVATPIEYSSQWQYGYKQVFEYAKSVENKYDKIYITYDYDQPYVYYLFFNKINPTWYQQNWDYEHDGKIDRMLRVIGKYVFVNIDFATTSKEKDVLIIGTPNEIPKDRAIKQIRFLDGTVAFRVAES